MRLTNEILHDFINCHYKAYIKSKGQSGVVSSFETYFTQIKQTLKIAFSKAILSKNTNRNNSIYDKNLIKEGVFLNLKFINQHIDISVDGIEFVDGRIIPMLIVPFEKVTNTDKLFISIQAILLQKEFMLSVENCKIISGKKNKTTNLKIGRLAKAVKLLLARIDIILSQPIEPELILNKHCQICEFCNYCKEKATLSSNMTLLDRITIKKIGKYKKKGIFTIEQLSYLYKPRRKKQRSKQLFTHNIELQALSIRNNKIYVQQLPAIKRQGVEIFLDIEGNPDIDNYYLIGILIANAENAVFKTFWADNSTEEANIWLQFTSLIDQYPHCPIYHYGNYETKAIKTLGTRYNTDISQFRNRLLNINQSIYGKIYFPVYSNRLKEIGHYIGATWSANNASGIQALVWRHQWEETHDEIHKQSLITYNYEDCIALKLLTEKLTSIEENADRLPEIDFAINPKKNATEKGRQVHNQFDSILKFGHENYDRKKISFNNIEDNETENKRKSGGQVGHKGGFRKVPIARTLVIVPMKKKCPIHNEKLLVMR